ncbi:MAG: uracil-DNA glycosylase [Thermodesulfobacteriota bacterium]
MPADPALVAELAANLACRARLGLGLVAAGPDSRQRLMAALAGRPAPPAADAPRPQPGGPRPSLAGVRADLGQCIRCGLSQARRAIVFGAGPQTARVMLIGEAPGEKEDERGEPFVGPAGQLLDKMLAAVGLTRSEVYITNLVKCRPPNNRDPRPEEAAACRPFLEGQIAAIAPRAILTLGRPAAQALLASDAPISALRGRWRDLDGVPLLPTFHPAFLLRSPERKAEAYADLKELRRFLAGPAA